MPHSKSLVEDMARLERTIVEFVQRPNWSPEAVEPEDNADWRSGYESAQANLREELKPWWPHGGPLDFVAVLKDRLPADDRELVERLRKPDLWTRTNADGSQTIDGAPVEAADRITALSASTLGDDCG